MNSLDRENNPFYVSASDAEIKAMLQSLKLNKLSDLFSNLPKDILFDKAPELPDALSYEDLKKQLRSLSEKNNSRSSFIGDALQQYKTHAIVNHVSSIRKLATSYTPYQPERSQGTLISLWIYQCLLSTLTGFEAINTSLYDRSTALYEALVCASRLVKNKSVVLLCESLLPQDLNVVKALISETRLRVVWIPFDKKTGITCLTSAKKLLEKEKDKAAALAFPQINQFGLLEDIHALTLLAEQFHCASIAVIDPATLATGGLLPPSRFGNRGVDIFVGEGQHLAIGPNFGGPGLGIFGLRFNKDHKNDIRSSPGRFVGKINDSYTLVLSSREQHIRKEKATSNICSNQAFIATLAGASLLAKGEEGLRKSCLAGFNQARKCIKALTRIASIELAFPQTPFFNECVLKLPKPAKTIIEQGLEERLHIGVDLSNRLSNHCLKISFTDYQSEEDCNKLISFFIKTCGAFSKASSSIPEIPLQYARSSPANLPNNISVDDIKTFYTKLGELNVSPDEAIFPLGSCTMKYNPRVNDWAANLDGFTKTHPQAPINDCQGALEILFEIQSWFKKITGLDAISTQPVAGAQGELISLKMFQAYHHKNNQERRVKILIPKSAHGTNFATAVMAGYSAEHIIYLQTNSYGHIDETHFNEVIKKQGEKIAAIMITNPNTSGLFEPALRPMTKKIHAIGGLVFMDGANMNAIAGWVNLKKLGIDAVHQNLHKTWSIPHGGGGPGDAVIAVDEKLADFLPGFQIIKNDRNTFELKKPKQSIGTFHRHFGNFAHKVRCYTYLRRLGKEGVRRISAIAVLSSRYLLNQVKNDFPVLPKDAHSTTRMHEFILTLNKNDFQRIEKLGLKKAQIIPRVGKLFLDFGYHSPTVAFPEPLGLMIEPTESFSKRELDRFAKTIKAISHLIKKHPEVLLSAPHFTPIRRVDEVAANRHLILSESLKGLPKLPNVKHLQKDLLATPPEKITEMIIAFPRQE